MAFFQVLCRRVAVVIVVVVVLGSVLSFKVQNKSECGVLFFLVNCFCIFANFLAFLVVHKCCCFLLTVAFSLLCKLKFSTQKTYRQDYKSCSHLHGFQMLFIFAAAVLVD